MIKHNNPIKLNLYAQSIANVTVEHYLIHCLKFYKRSRWPRLLKTYLIYTILKAIIIRSQLNVKEKSSQFDAHRLLQAEICHSYLCKLPDIILLYNSQRYRPAVVSMVLFHIMCTYVRIGGVSGCIYCKA